MADTRVNPIDAVHDIRRLITEVETALRKQQELLSLRDMSLPPDTFQMILAVRDDLARTEAQLVDDMVTLSQLRALAGTTNKINSSLDLDTVLAEAMDNVIALTGAERGYIVLANPFSNELEFRIARDPEQPGGAVDFQGSRTILRDVLDSGQTLLADNAYKDPRFLQSSATIARLALRSVLCVPIKLKDRVIGAVYVDNRMRAGVFTQREAELLTAFANQAAVAIENARLYARVQASIAAISEMKDLMDSVFASIGSGVVTTDTARAVATFNRAAAEILAWDVDRVPGQPLPALVPHISVDLDEQLAEVTEHSHPSILEAEQENPARGRIALSLKLSPLKDARQTTQGVAVVLDDLTQQREGEELLNIMRRYLPPEMVDNIESIATIDLGGERREITCMFVNVRSLATFPPGLRPAAFMELLNRHLAVATDAIHSCKGVIDKYMGHEVMALFNSQLNPQDHHAILAVEAALIMRDAFVDLYTQLGISPDPHYYRVGINTGVATLGNVGSLSRRDFTAIGDTINLAKRLEENAGAGQIIVSDTTRQHIAGAGGLPSSVAFHPLEAIQVKGRQQRTPIYEVFRA